MDRGSVWGGFAGGAFAALIVGASAGYIAAKKTEGAHRAEQIENDAIFERYVRLKLVPGLEKVLISELTKLERQADSCLERAAAAKQHAVAATTVAARAHGVAKMRRALRKARRTIDVDMDPPARVAAHPLRKIVPDYGTYQAKERKRRAAK
jgi:hypothetical protein